MGTSSGSRLVCPKTSQESEKKKGGTKSIHTEPIIIIIIQLHCLTRTGARSRTRFKEQNSLQVHNLSFVVLESPLDERSLVQKRQTQN